MRLLLAPGAPARCDFPERTHWLAAELGVALDPVPCPELEEWLADLAPAGLTLVFPESFVNNPASAFGHTLLRVDRGGADRDLDLLSYAVNFAAETGGDLGAAYAVKGLFGLYEGRFTTHPYYEKLQQYGDAENRDIWEYPLAFDEAEMMSLLRHLWELRETGFAYYFFDDNCSYQLLRLFAVAREGLDVDVPLRLWVIPVDTVRTTLAEIGLRSEPRFRPSPATTLRARVRALPAAQQELALGLAEGRIVPEAPELAELPEPERAAVLSLAYDALRSRFVGRKVSRDASLSRARRLLVARSRLPSGEPPAPEAPEVSPERGHETTRALLTGGTRGHRAFLEARVRPAFHHALDPGEGYTPGAQIVVFEPVVRYFPADEQVRLHAFTLLDIESLSPRDRFIAPWSWRLSTGLRTRLLPEADGALDPEPVWSGEGGVGLTYALGRWVLLFGFGQLRLEAGPDLDHQVAFAPEALAGLQLGGREGRWRGRLQASAGRYVAGDVSNAFRAGLAQRVTLTRSLALLGEVSWERSYRQDRLHAGAGVGVYF